MADFNLENQYNSIIAGVDEAGYGPWAGPVVTSAVVIIRNQFPKDLAFMINDSKQLSPSKREEIYQSLILEEGNSCYISVDQASVTQIEQSNILQATLDSMARAICNLALQPEVVLIDGIRKPVMSNYEIVTVKQGDSKSITIAAASIIAKVTRDKIMKEYHTQYPHYGWDTNVGYGTAKHQKAIMQYGICPLHRKSFKPIAKLAS